MAEWQDWIGRIETRSDQIDPGMVTRWLATLDRAAPGDGAVPQGLHWCLGLPDAPTALLGEDGHPRRDESPDSFLPPLPLPRRMWASSKVEFLTPLRVGEPVTRQSRVVAITEKSGSSGPLIFVDLEHATSSADSVAVREVQSLVYREAVAAGTSPVRPPLGQSQFDRGGWDAHRLVEPDEALLFRFSALTFNSHRIHYDLPYATQQEGYRGLVVHGPLTATLLLDLARRQFGDNALKRFAFRGLSPAICGEPLHLVLKGSADSVELGAFGADGRQVMGGSAAL